MRAVRFSEAKGLRVEDVPVPTPAANEVLIRVLRAGICSTDLEIIRGYVGGFDHTLGHEFVGVVEAAPPGDAQSFVGKRVVGEINCRCGEFRHPDPIFIRNHAPITSSAWNHRKRWSHGQICNSACRKHPHCPG